MIQFLNSSAVILSGAQRSRRIRHSSFFHLVLRWHGMTALRSRATRVWSFDYAHFVRFAQDDGAFVCEFRGQP